MYPCDWALIWRGDGEHGAAVKLSLHTCLSLTFVICFQRDFWHLFICFSCTQCHKSWVVSPPPRNTVTAPTWRHKWISVCPPVNKWLPSSLCLHHSQSRSFLKRKIWTEFAEPAVWRLHRFHICKSINNSRQQLAQPYCRPPVLPFLLRPLVTKKRTFNSVLKGGLVQTLVGRRHSPKWMMRGGSDQEAAGDFENSETTLQSERGAGNRSYYVLLRDYSKCTESAKKH